MWTHDEVTTTELPTPVPMTVQQYRDAVVMSADDWHVIADALAHARRITITPPLPDDVERHLMGMTFREVTDAPSPA